MKHCNPSIPKAQSEQLKTAILGFSRVSELTKILKIALSATDLVISSIDCLPDFRGAR
jgi:hypothetical protein